MNIYINLYYGVEQLRVCSNLNMSKLVKSFVLALLQINHIITLLVNNFCYN